MAITAYTGPPGAGKSYAMVGEVIVNGVLAGRRVLTNVDGVKPEAIYAYCADKDPDAKLGEIVLFHGNDAHDPMFWPHEQLSDEHTFVKGGDLIVFDEWKLYFAESGQLQSDTVVPFIRWHRHLTDENGRACDMVIGTQIMADLHRKFRGTVERSYAFKKLNTVGLNSGYTFKVYEGRLQNKDSEFRTGHGKYKPEIFELYSSYSEGKDGTELKTDKRASMFSGVWMWLGGAALLLVLFGAWNAFSFFTSGSDETVVDEASQAAQTVAPRPVVPVEPNWRIAGHVVAHDGMRVVLQSKEGAVRYVTPETFLFDGNRPVAGTFNGQRITADEWVLTRGEISDAE